MGDLLLNRKIFWFLGFVFTRLFVGPIPGLELGNQLAIFPIGFRKIIQGEYTPMRAFLATYPQPFFFREIISQGVTPMIKSTKRKISTACSSWISYFVGIPREAALRLFMRHRAEALL